MGTLPRPGDGGGPGSQRDAGGADLDAFLAVAQRALARMRESAELAVRQLERELETQGVTEGDGHRSAEEEELVRTARALTRQCRRVTEFCATIEQRFGERLGGAPSDGARLIVLQLASQGAGEREIGEALRELGLDDAEELARRALRAG